MVVEEMPLTKRLALVAEAVDHLEKVQIMVAVANMVLVLVVLRVLQYVKRVEVSHLH